MSLWKVHTYHINIDVGDSAIHLLVDETPPATVHRAVLIDGGEDTDTVIQIEKVIKLIEDSYRFDSNGQLPSTTACLRFDSIVITHWDGDHYGGVLALLLRGYHTQVTNHPSFKALITQSATDYTNTPASQKTDLTEEKIADLVARLDLVAKQPKLQTLPSRYMKYGTALPTLQVTGNPPSTLFPNSNFELLTTMYAPYQYVSCNLAAGAAELEKFSDGVGSSSLELASGDPIFCCNQGALYNPYLGKPNELDVRMIAEYQRAWPGTNPVGEEKEFYFARACKLMAHPEPLASSGPDGYLGAELFTNTLLPTGHTPAQMTTPLALLNAHGVQAGVGPRIFIVAGAQKIIGGVNLAAVPAGPIVTNAASRRRVEPNIGTREVKLVNDKVPPPDGEDVLRTGSIRKNSCSICCLMLTKSTTGVGWANKHYFAGDALWDVESAITTWANPSATPPARIEFLKLSQ